MQVYYSLQARDIEYELVPLAVDQGLGILVWSPFAGGLSVRQVPSRSRGARGQPAPGGAGASPPVHDEDKLYDTIEELVAIGKDHDVSAARVAWRTSDRQARGDLGDCRRAGPPSSSRSNLLPPPS